MIYGKNWSQIAKVLWCAALLLSFRSALADPSPLMYQQITNSSGLSNSSINCIYQDSTGLVWFGSWDGLNVYNGSNFKVYKPEAKNDESITNNIIRAIIEERQGLLWIATDEGINRFDLKTQKFKRFYFQTGDKSSRRENSYLIAKNNRNVVFCAVYELGLSYFNTEKQEFVPLQIPGVNTFKIRGLFFDSKNGLWILQESGELFQVSVFQDGKGNMEVRNMKRATSARLMGAFPDNGSGVWLPGFGKDIVYLDISTAQLHYYQTETGAFSTQVSAITSYQGKLLVAQANGGVLQFHIDGNRVVKEDHLLLNQSVFSLYKGSQGILWVGTDGQGIYKIYSSRKNFLSYSNDEIQGIANNPIRSFAEVTPGILYVGTKGGGIYKVAHVVGEKGAPAQNKLMGRIDTGTGLKNDAVYALFYKNGYLWIGTDGSGIQSLEIKTNRLVDLSEDLSHFTDATFGSVYAICATDDSTIWLGTSGYGLIRLNVECGKRGLTIKKYKKYTFNKEKRNWISSNIIYSLFADDKHSLWIGTRGGGLNRLDLQTENFTVFKASKEEHSISSNDVLSIAGDRKGMLWIGTSDGVNSLKYTVNTGKATFRSYFEKDGLPNNTTHGIIIEENGNIWISTNNGVSLLNQSNERFINFTTADGLLNNEFSDGAYYKSPYNGNIYFGGIGGFNAFHPSEILTSTYEPSIFINSIKLYNNTPIAVTGNISLKHDQNFFTLDFTALDYINNEKCQYAYILENFNEDWIYTGTSHLVNFTNVPPGRYILKIKSTNGDGLWSNKVYTLPITIGLPWWRTGYAYFIYILIALGALFLLYRAIQMRVKHHRSLWEERMNRKREEVIHEEKLRFFTNIAHEFCTPLTLIYGPCENILEHRFTDSFIRKHVKIIKSNAERMLSLIQQLMEFRRTESEFLPLYVEEIDLHEMLNYITDSFAESVERNKIKFKVHIDQSLSAWKTDRSSLEKIMFNLISNAFKYTPDNGIINVTIGVSGKMLCIVVENSGDGIRKEDIDKLFNKFKVLDHLGKISNSGLNVRTGLGLSLTKGLVKQLDGEITVQSVPGEKTTFNVVIPSGEKLKNRVIDARPLENERSSYIGLNKQLKNIGNGTWDKPDGSLKGNEDQSEKKNVVLIIDDDDDIRNFLFELLSSKYTVLCAENAHKATERLKEQLPDIIICDVLMEGMSGIEFSKEIKSSFFTRHIPLILLSGKSTVDDQIKGLSEGADVYVPKPFYPSHLKIIVERLLKSRRDLKSYFNSTVSEMQVYDGETVSREDYELITKAVQFIEQNLDSNTLTPTSLCKELAYSKMQFYRKIKGITNQTPSEFIRHIRLKFAAKQIATTNKTIQEVMYEAGFNNKAYFFREFNKMYKTSPLEYRRSLNVTKN